MRIEVTTDDAGRRALEKRAETDQEAVRLRREADVLRVAGHPGLVELLAFDDGPEPCLRTGFLEGGGLAEARHLEVEEVAGVVAALASTLADLHAMGLVHGAVAPEHVVLDEDGRPVLCSTGYGGLAGERASSLPVLPATFTDPSRGRDVPLATAHDVLGAGAILQELLHGPAVAAPRGRAEALERLARWATSAAPADRPSARRLADAVHDAVVSARLPKREEGSAEPPTGPLRERGDDDVLRARQQPLDRWRQDLLHPPPPRSRRVLLLALAAVSVVAAGMLLMSRGRPQERVSPQTSPSLSEVPGLAADGLPGDGSPEGTSTTHGGRVLAPPAAPTAGCSMLQAVASADVDADGCAEAVRFADGVLEAGSLRWSVGQSGDVATVGDWSCVGFRSLAVLRPDTGEVFAFEGWATAGRDVQAPLVDRVGGGRTLRAADLNGDGCHELVVERATGAPVVLRIPEGGSR